MLSLKRNNKRISWLVSLLALALCTPLLAEQTINPFTAVYSVSRNETVIGVRTHSLSLNNNQYIYKAQMHATGFASLFKSGEITETSQWRLVNNRVTPTNYEYQDSDNEKRHAQLVFNWKKNLVTNKVGKKPWKMKIPNGTQDKFSYMIALMHDLKQGKKEVEYKIADGGRLKTYKFKILKNETIDTPLGKFNTVKLQRIRSNKKNRITYLWTLPEKDYLPIKIERHKKGNVFSMIITELKP